MSWVVVGRVIRAHGIRGALKLRLDNPDSETLRKGLAVRVGDRAMTVAQVMGGHRYAFEELTDRDAAEALKGKPVSVRREDLPDLDEDEFYLVDLEGLPAVDAAGETLGTIVGFSDNGAQPLAHVDTGRGEVQVPLVAPILVSIEDDRVILDPPGGLFDDDDDDEVEAGDGEAR